MFFLSGASFSPNNVIHWLLWVSYINPLTYGVDALRTAMMGGTWVRLFPMYLNITVLLLFDSVMFALGTYAFSRTE
ncbi:MAG: ABC transporter permease [Methanobacteriota archaeon]